MTDNEAYKIKVIISQEVNDFLSKIDISAKTKIIFNIDKIANGHRDAELFKKLENTDIWEFRTRYNKIQYRLLAFWDTNTETLIVTTHGFIKKTQKTPIKEIQKAENAMKEYYRNTQQKK